MKERCLKGIGVLDSELEALKVMLRVGSDGVGDGERNAEHVNGTSR